MSKNVDLGVVKLGTTVTHKVNIADVAGVVSAKPGCGGCTKIVSFNPNEISFTFTPDSTGTPTKQIYLRDKDGQTVETIYFKATVQ